MGKRKCINVLRLLAIVFVVQLPKMALCYQSTEPRRGAATDRDRQQRRPDSPVGQAEWFTVGRLSPPSPRRARGLAPQSSAAEKLRQAFSNREQVSALTPVSPQRSWTELGPRPELRTPWGMVSGRITSIALDPGDANGNTMFVGTAFGGVWKCAVALSDNPQCSPLGDYQVSLSIGSVAAVSREGGTYVYVGTGEANNSLDSYYGQGILRSRDGGKSWDPPRFIDKNGHNFSGAAISKVVIHPTSPNIVFAAVTSASLADGRAVNLGVYKSTDSGDTWSLSLGTGGVSDMIYEPTRNMLFAAVSGRGVYRYTESTDHWELVHSPFQCKVAITDGNCYRASLTTREGTVWLLISNSQGELSEPGDDDTGLVESDNGGDQWLPVQAPQELFGGQGYYDQFVAAPPKTSQLIVAGIDVWSTEATHGLKTKWDNLTSAYYTDQVHPDQHAIAFLDSKRWYLGNDGGLWLTRNSGGNWANQNYTLGDIQFISVTPDPNVVGEFLGGSQDNGTAYNLAEPRLKWSETLSGDGGYTGVDTKHHYFAENYQVNLWYSDSPGRQWKSVVDDRTISEREGFYIPYVVLENPEPRIVLGTYRAWVGPATPECPGEGWRPVSADLTRGFGYVQALAAVARSSTVIAVTTDFTILRTKNVFDAEPTWEDLADGNLPTRRAFSSVAVSPVDPETIYVGVLGFGTGDNGTGTGHIFKRVKVDDGYKWTDITGNLSDVPVNSIAIGPTYPTDVYVATDAGVWLATDGGKPNAKWTPYGQNLPHSAVLQLSLVRRGNGALVAATHGRGAWTIPTYH